MKNVVSNLEGGAYETCLATIGMKGAENFAQASWVSVSSTAASKGYTSL